jgi:hypothetical protein
MEQAFHTYMHPWSKKLLRIYFGKRTKSSQTLSRLTGGLLGRRSVTGFRRGGRHYRRAEDVPTSCSQAERSSEIFVHGAHLVPPFYKLRRLGFRHKHDTGQPVSWQGGPDKFHPGQYTQSKSGRHYQNSCSRDRGRCAGYSHRSRRHTHIVPRRARQHEE